MWKLKTPLNHHTPSRVCYSQTNNKLVIKKKSSKTKHFQIKLQNVLQIRKITNIQNRLKTEEKEKRIK